MQAFYSKKLSDGLSPKTINNIHGLLHKALSNAVKWNILPRNVCDAVTPPRISRKEKTVLTIEQAYTLLREIKNHRMEALFTLAMVTGMRRGELLACLICAFTMCAVSATVELPRRGRRLGRLPSRTPCLPGEETQKGK